MSEPARAINDERKPPPPWWRDDYDYILPMAVFLLFVWIGGTWKSLYPISYLARTIIVVALLIFFWRRYTKIRWNYWWLGVLVGVLGIFQWIGMQLWLQNFSVQHHLPFFKPPDDVFNPLDPKTFSSPALAYSFIALRIFGAVLVVPVMEELFWRDYLWRQILAPNDFKLADVGEFAWGPFLAVPFVFAMVHGNWWLTAIVWALMIGVLLVYTKSLGACIIAHAVTNLLLALYVLKTHDWAFW